MTRCHCVNFFIASFLCSFLIVSFLTLRLLYPWRSIVPIEMKKCSEIETPKIPKIVHRIWDRETIPPKYQKYLQTCKQLNPDYEVMMWNATWIESFLKKHYSWAVDMYYLYPETVLKYDAARYFIIYHYGGIYLDMDMDCVKSFDSILSSTTKEYDVILGEAFPIGIVSNFIIAKHKSEFFSQVTHNLQNTKDETFIVSLYQTFVRTGPLFLWKNYLNFPCMDQIYVLSKFKIRGEWLTHDGAATWQKSDAKFIMYISNTWAAMFSYLNCVILVVIGTVLISLFVKKFCMRNGSSHSHGSRSGIPTLHT